MLILVMQYSMFLPYNVTLKTQGNLIIGSYLSLHLITQKGKLSIAATFWKRQIW